jgi:hypothetical protein
MYTGYLCLGDSSVDIQACRVTWASLHVMCDWHHSHLQLDMSQDLGYFVLSAPNVSSNGAKLAPGFISSFYETIS